MSCERCGRQLGAGERFCSACGAPVPRVSDQVAEAPASEATGNGRSPRWGLWAAAGCAVLLAIGGVTYMVWPEDDDDGPGRGAPVGQLTFQGADVQDPNGLNKRLTSQWRSRVLGDSRKANVPKGAGCYLQVAGEELASKTICGPVRFEDGKTTWMGRGLTLGSIGAGGPTDTHVTSRGKWTEGAKPLPNATVTTSDGVRADFTAKLAPPDAPKATVGEMTRLKSTDANQTEPTVSTGAPYWLEVYAGKPASTAGSGSERRMAPKGATMVTFTVGPEGESESDLSSSLALVVDGKRYPVKGGVPKSGEGLQSWTVAVPGDGKGTAVEVTQRGNVSRYSLDSGELVHAKGKAPGTLHSRAIKGSHEENNTQYVEEKWDVKGTGDWEVRRSIKPEGKAPEGKVWAVAKVKVSGTPMTRTLHDPDAELRYSTTYRVTSAKVGDVAGRIESSKGGHYRIVFALPEGRTPGDLTLQVRLEGKLTSEKPDSVLYVEEDVDRSRTLTLR